MNLPHEGRVHEGHQTTGRAVPVVQIPEGLRALSKDKPNDPAAVARYLEGKLGDALRDVRAGMNHLARSRPPRRSSWSQCGEHRTIARDGNELQSRGFYLDVLPRQCEAFSMTKIP